MGNIGMVFFWFRKLRAMGEANKRTFELINGYFIILTFSIFECRVSVLYVCAGFNCARLHFE